MGNFQSMIEEAKALVREKIENKDNRPDYMSEKQLYFVLDELDKMARIRNVDLFHPYYPRGIAESWEYSDRLGMKLLDLVDVYRQL